MHLDSNDLLQECELNASRTIVPTRLDRRSFFKTLAKTIKARRFQFKDSSSSCFITIND